MNAFVVCSSDGIIRYYTGWSWSERFEDAMLCELDKSRHISRIFRHSYVVSWDLAADYANNLKQKMFVVCNGKCYFTGSCWSERLEDAKLYEQVDAPYYLGSCIIPYSELLSCNHEKSLGKNTLPHVYVITLNYTWWFTGETWSKKLEDAYLYKTEEKALDVIDFNRHNEFAVVKRFDYALREYHG